MNRNSREAEIRNWNNSCSNDTITIDYDFYQYLLKKAKTLDELEGDFECSDFECSDEFAK